MPRTLTLLLLLLPLAASPAAAARAARQATAAAAAPQTAALDGNESVYRSSEVTTRAVITYKPEPGFTEQARQRNVAVLGADGRVRHIIAVRRLPAGLTEKSVEAARRIRFTPATVNGVPVSQFVMLEYNFNIY
jgi:hypothetical protein